MPLGLHQHLEDFRKRTNSLAILSSLNVASWKCETHYMQGYLYGHIYMVHTIYIYIERKIEAR